MNVKEAERIGRRWFEMWNNPDFNIADEIIDPNYNPSWTNIDAVGPAQVKREITYFRSVFPDLEYDIIELKAEEEKVWIHYRGRATHKGEGWGFKPTNKTVEFEGVSILYLNSVGKVIDQWDAFSFYDLFFELGLVPSLGELHEYLTGFKK